MSGITKRRAKPKTYHLTEGGKRASLLGMTSKQVRYRDRRIAEGAKPLYALMSAEAIANMDHLCGQIGLSRKQLLEKMFAKPVDRASLPE
jgi:hypothetical protein